MRRTLSRNFAAILSYDSLIARLRGETRFSIDPSRIISDTLWSFDSRLSSTEDWRTNLSNLLSIAINTVFEVKL